MITAEIISKLNKEPNLELKPSKNRFYLKHIHGSLENIAQIVSPPDLCNKDSLVFASNLEQFQIALNNKAAIIVYDKKIKDITHNHNTTLFEVESIPLAMAQILVLFDGKLNRFIWPEKIHPSSVIHPTAHIGTNVSIGPHTVIGEQAHIGDNSTIGANCVVESYAKLGVQTLLHPHVFIGSHCILGNNCEIHPHTTIGSDGYGYAPSTSGEIVKISQLGVVKIGDNVEIGANCAIDRATLTETIIHNGVKIDNLCHIAHNCEVGENSLITAGFMTAGSTKIGKYFMTGGSSVVADHIKIADKVTLAGRSTVTRNITEPGQYGGHPVQPMTDYLKNLAVVTQLLEIKKSLNRVLKHLNLTDSK